MPQHEHDTPEPIELHVELGRGSLRVHATDTTTTTVEVTGPRADDVTVTRTAQGLSILGPRQGLGGLLGGEPRIDVSVTLPARSALVTRLGSADLVATGTLGPTKVRTGSGDVTLETADAPVAVQTGSGDITVERCAGPLKLQTGSGDVVVGSTHATTSISTGSGDVSITENDAPTVVKTGSGDLLLATVAADASFTTGSGDLRVREVVRGRLTTKGASGSVRIGVRAGVPVWTDISTVSGSIRSDLRGAGQPEPGQDHLELRTTTVSGDVVLTEV